jgi:hypothetical protein
MIEPPSRGEPKQERGGDVYDRYSNRCANPSDKPELASFRKKETVQNGFEPNDDGQKTKGGPSLCRNSGRSFYPMPCSKRVQFSLGGEIRGLKRSEISNGAP